MDLSKLSEKDLLALKAGNLSGVSDEGLMSLKGESKPDGLMQHAGNVLAGGVRGAGSIGATIMRALPNALGGDTAEENAARRQSMDDALQSMGAQPDSLMYKGGKLGAEIAGTAGAGGAIAKAVPFAPAVATAIRSGGMSTGLPAATTVAQKAVDLALRTGGGAITGAASAGAVNPEDAGAGAFIGGVAPSVIRAAGTAGSAMGSSMADKLAKKLQEYQASAPKRMSIESSINAGYVIPPATVDPSYINRLMESISGKQATQQIASSKNTQVTGDLARQALGLAPDVPLSRSTLEGVRKSAGGAYADVAALSPAAQADLEALKVARNEATGWFSAYNRSARPDDLAKAKAARALGEQLEQSLEQHAQQAGKPELIPALRDARKQIAKSYTVERGLNDASGEVDARVIGRILEKGAPLTDELETIGRFGSAFPTVAKTGQQVGSPDTHNLKSIASMLMGGGGAAALGPAGLAGAAIPFAAPPVARSIMFRKGAQESLIPKAPEANRQIEWLVKLLNDPQAQQAIARTAPVIGASSSP